MILKALFDGTYACCESKVENPYAHTETDEDTYTGCKALCNVIGKVDAKRYQYPTESLKGYRRPHYPIISDKKVAFGNGFSINEKDADEESREQGIE